MAWLVYSHRGVAKRLVLDIEPAGARAGVAFDTQPVGHLVDGSGLLSRAAGVTVTASKTAGSGTLGGTLTALTDDEGVFAFSDLSMSAVAGGVTLQFASGALVAVECASFNVTASGYVLAGDAASYAWSGSAVTLGYGRRLTAGLAAYAWTPAAATLRSGRRLTATTRAYAWTGTAATLTYSAGISGYYTTSFPATENPISEGGVWINGGTTGLDWTNVRTAPGFAYGTQAGVTLTDSTAILTGSWAADQQATAVVYTSGTVPSAANYPEVELRLRSAISAHSNTGYEISWSLNQGSSGYLIIVRWNGPYGDYTVLNSAYNVSANNVVDGDVVSATIIGNTISAYKNGALVMQATDSTYASGAPGMGFNLEGNPGTNANFGYSLFHADDIAAVLSGNLWNHGFEDGTDGGFNATSGSPDVGTVVTGTGAWEGARYYDVSYGGSGSDFGLSSYKDLGAAHNNTWVSFMLKVVTMPSSGIATQKMLIFREVGYNRQLGEMNEISGRWIWSHLNGGLNLDVAPITTGTWQRFKLHYDQTGTYAVITIWIDGTQVYTSTDDQTVASKALTSIVCFGGTLNGGSGASHFQFDDIHIGTSDPG